MCFVTFAALDFGHPGSCATHVAAPQSNKFGHKGGQTHNAVTQDLRPGRRTALLLHLTTHLLESIELGLGNLLRLLRLENIPDPHTICCLAESSPLRTQVPKIQQS